MAFWMVLSILAIFSPVFTNGALARDQGNGKLHVLQPVQDVWLERSKVNYDRRSIHQIIVGHLERFPKKRSLIQFQSLPNSCPIGKIRWAKMYLYFVSAHRWSRYSTKSQPWLSYVINIHRVKKQWNEAQATTVRRLRYSSRGSLNWSKPYLDLGQDAEAQPQCNPTTIYTNQPRGFVGFDVTGAVRSWREGSPNYGLLLKVERENIYGRGLRFNDRHHPNINFRPRLHVMCEY